MKKGVEVVEEAIASRPVPMKGGVEVAKEATRICR